MVRRRSIEGSPSWTRSPQVTSSGSMSCAAEATPAAQNRAYCSTVRRSPPPQAAARSAMTINMTRTGDLILASGVSGCPWAFLFVRGLNRQSLLLPLS